MVKGKSNDSKKSNARAAVPAELPPGPVLDRATEDVSLDRIELIVESNNPKQRKQPAAAAYNGPMRKRAKGKLEEVRPDAAPFFQPDAALPLCEVQGPPSLPTSDPASSDPIPDAATSLSAVIIPNFEGRAIAHIDHRTGEVLGTYKSCYAAAKSLGISRHIVASLVKGIYKANRHKGWTFCYATGDEESLTVVDRSNKKVIEQIDVATGNVMATFPSDAVASKETGVTHKDISLMLKGELESQNGWTFRLVDTVYPDIVKSEPLDSSVGHLAQDLGEDLDVTSNIVEESGDCDEPTDYTVHKITVTDQGSLGIMARKARAPTAVRSLFDLLDGGSENDMNLVIDSFVTADSIAEKFGMQVGDFLFLSVSGSHEKQMYGAYKSVAFYVRRKPRPTAFFVVRSTSNVMSLSRVIDDGPLEDMDPMKDLQENLSDFIYHPITITDPGPLGIKVVKRKCLPKGVDAIPYFYKLDSDSDFDYNCEFSMAVDSLIEKNCLARKFGIQAGDYLVLPSSGHSLAMYICQEAFYLQTYEGVLHAIQNSDRPLVLYAIRLKSGITATKPLNQADGKYQEKEERTIGTKTATILPSTSLPSQNNNKKSQRKEIPISQSSGKPKAIKRKPDLTTTGVEIRENVKKPVKMTTKQGKKSIKPMDVTGQTIDLMDDHHVLKESSDYKLFEIIVADHGSIGILAQKSKAPESAISLPWTLFNCDDHGEMNLRIHSFIGKNSIAEKSGMRVGDYLFLSRDNPEYGGAFREVIHGEYESVAYYIRRDPRPTRFYIVRSKLNVLPSISLNMEDEEEMVEDMDPMKDFDTGDERSGCTYHPIILTEYGPLGILAKESDDLPEGYDDIPYFFNVDDDFDGDDHSNGDRSGYFQVKSLVGTNCPAREYGLQAGDYLVRPSTDYTPTKYNYQEAFFVGCSSSFEIILRAIKKKKRPHTLYAIRLKSNCKAAASNHSLGMTVSIDQSSPIENTRISGFLASDPSDTSGKFLKKFGESDVRESPDYKILEIAITEQGSMGIMARRTKAPAAVKSLIDLVDGDAEDEMNLRIDSFIGTDSIAEKFGMQVGDYLFHSLLQPGAIGEHYELVHGEYKSVSYYIRRNPRPTTFYAIRSKSGVLVSTMNTIATSCPQAEDELVEEMDPLQFIDIDNSRCGSGYYCYHPIRLTEDGPLGIVTCKKQEYDDFFDEIPFFFPVDTMSDSNQGESLFFDTLQVQSFHEPDCLACKFGIQVGDYLVLASPNHTPAASNHEEAFFVNSYDITLEAIENGDRPVTLYAIRSKSNCNSPGVLCARRSFGSPKNSGLRGSMNDFEFHSSRSTVFI